MLESDEYWLIVLSWLLFALVLSPVYINLEPFGSVISTDCFPLLPVRIFADPPVGP